MGVLGVSGPLGGIPDAEAYEASSRSYRFRQWGDTFDESKFRDLASAMIDIFAGQFPGFQSLLNDTCASNKRRSTER